MPTENKPAEPFQREDRYIVIKRSDLDKMSPLDRDVALSNLEHVAALLFGWNAPERKCLVIESDWPEYEPAWQMIERRMTGQPPVTAAEELDAVLHWRGKHAQLIRERAALQADLDARDQRVDELEGLLFAWYEANAKGLIKVDDAAYQIVTATAEALNPTPELDALKAQPQGEAVYQVEYLGDGGGGWSDVEYREYKAYLGKPDFRTRTLYVAQPQGEPSHWTDPAGNTITAELKAYNLALGGAPASASSHYAEPLYRHPTPASAQGEPVAVALPPRKPAHATAPDNDMRARLECKHKGYNEALDDVARLNARQVAVAYQYRQRPLWRKDDKSGWMPWRDCSQEAHAEYTAAPELHDWQYETRTLYAGPNQQ